MLCKCLDQCFLRAYTMPSLAASLRPLTCPFPPFGQPFASRPLQTFLAVQKSKQTVRKLVEVDGRDD
jgi:hypothetical protein